MRQMGAHGEGSITRRKDGRLQVAVTMPSGKRVYRMVTASKDGREQRRAAERIKRDLLAARRADLEPSTQTLAAYLRSWLAGLRDARHAKVRPRTIEFYDAVCEGHIIPTLGGYRLDRLSERHVQAWLDVEPGSLRSLRHYHAVLRRALNVGLRQRVIARNVAAGVDLPDAPIFEGNPLTADEAHRLLEATQDARLGALWRLALVTGLRQGELLGLGWDDIDLDAGTVTVTAQLQRIAGSWMRVEPKADRAIERIAIDPATVDALRAHKLRQAAERTPDWRYWGLAFVTPRGNPIGRAEALRAFHAACDLAGITRRRMHDLRGSNATLLADLGIAEDVRMARLGHATRKVHRHYAQASETLDREAVRRLAEAIA